MTARNAKEAFEKQMPEKVVTKMWTYKTGFLLLVQNREATDPDCLTGTYFTVDVPKGTIRTFVPLEDLEGFREIGMRGPIPMNEL